MSRGKPQVIPRQLCDNAGFDATDVLNKLRQKHALPSGEGAPFGVDINTGGIADSFNNFVWEPAVVKINAINAATEAACLILSVDEIVKNPKSESAQGEVAASAMEIDSDIKDSSRTLIKQGAEARVFESNFVGRTSIIKERFSKKYRHPSLDSKLTLKRLNAEARCMTKARRLGVTTPVLYGVDPLLHTLTFEFVEGRAVKDILLEFGLHGVVEERLDDIATQIGDAIGKLHDGGLVHGDLTTSNMLICNGTNQLVLIDFGLSFTSTLPEDKAVDLYVLERALLSMHSSCGNVMDRILASYRKSSKQWLSTMNKLAQVRQRGRKRTMIG